MTKRKILIVDDHPILRKGLALLINQEPDLVVSAEAEHAQMAIESIEKNLPDMAIVDISLPGIDGIELIKELKLRHKDIPVLVVSMHDETLYAERSLRAGARGYIMKQEALDKVLVAIRKVLEGEIFVSERITTKMLEKFVSVEGVSQATSPYGPPQQPRTNRFQADRTGQQDPPDSGKASPEHKDSRVISGPYKG